jgi:hypothetical protein
VSGDSCSVLLVIAQWIRTPIPWMPRWSRSSSTGQSSPSSRHIVEVWTCCFLAHRSTWPHRWHRNRSGFRRRRPRRSRLNSVG